MTLKEQVIDARINKGMTYSDIYDVYGVPKSTARDWVVAYEEDEGYEDEDDGEGYYYENLNRDGKMRFKKTEEEILDFLSNLAPIKVEASKPSASVTHTNYAIVGSDFHFGTEDQKAIDVFLKTVEQIKPKIIVLNGDTMDFLAISRYPKDIKSSWSLQDERVRYHKFLNSLLSVSGNAKIYETTSNHSGQSIDGRWRRYLSERIGELGSLSNISEILSYENVFLGDFKDKVKHVDFVELNDLVVTHGTTVRKNGGNSARGEIDKWHTSILHGHTHRIGSSCQRIPAIGRKPEKQLYGFEGGCLCSLDASYGTAMNWQQGFNIVGIGTDGHEFSVEQVMIQHGSANIATLGATIKA